MKGTKVNKKRPQLAHFFKKNSVINFSYPSFNKARTGPRSAARFSKILKLCNKFISIHYRRKYKYMGYPNVGDNCLKLIPGDIV